MEGFVSFFPLPDGDGFGEVFCSPGGVAGWALPHTLGKVHTIAFTS